VQEQARIYGEPTLRLEFQEGKLMQLFSLPQNTSTGGSSMLVWVEVQGQLND
jgi:hypothetical protein